MRKKLFLVEIRWQWQKWINGGFKHYPVILYAKRKSWGIPTMPIHTGHVRQISKSLPHFPPIFLKISWQIPKFNELTSSLFIYFRKFTCQQLFVILNVTTIPDSHLFWSKYKPRSMAQINISQSHSFKKKNYIHIIQSKPEIFLLPFSFCFVFFNDNQTWQLIGSK